MSRDERLALCARLGLSPPAPGKTLRMAAVAKALRKLNSQGMRIFLTHELEVAGLIPSDRF
jgi:hypothetical protein